MRPSSLLALVLLAACGDPGGLDNPLTDPDDGPAAGNPDGACEVPAEAGLADVTNPRSVVGDGTPASCTEAALAAAVATGGIVTFDCGGPVTITLTQALKVTKDLVLDGAGAVTLSGGHTTRILDMNTGNFEATGPLPGIVITGPVLEKKF